jgi:hypothetical protein
MADTAGNTLNPGQPAISDYSGMVRMVGNKELNSIAAKEKADLEQQQKPELIGTAAHLWKLWEAAKNAKWQVDERLAKCIRARKGKYEPDDLAAIREFGGSEIYMMLTNVKSRSIEAQIKDILLPAGEKPWGIDPTSVPDVPQEVVERVVTNLKQELMEIMQVLGPGVPITPEMIDLRMAELMGEARSEIRKVAKTECLDAEMTVEDLLSEGGFYDELADFIKDFSTYLTAFIRGPFSLTERKLAWKQRGDGTSYPDYENQSVMKYKRVSPFDIYPAPAAKNLNDGYLFERMRIRPAALQAFKTSEGFSTKAIEATMLDHRAGYLSNWLWTDQERANIESRPQEMTDPTAMIEALLFHGEIPARMLSEWGIKYDGDISEEVPVAAMLCGNRVLMLRINRHPLNWKPYYAASFDPSADSIWGSAPPELMEDCQRMCNASARALANNMGIASGPQVEVFKDRIAPSDDIERLWPWKVWKTESDPSGSGRPAINFYQPDLVTSQLMEIFNFFYNQAGEQLGVPAYDQGSPSANSGGAGQTAHGLAMLMNASSKIMKDAIGYIDRNVIKKIVFQTWLHAIISGRMEYSGDINIVARASEYLIIAEQLQARRQEFLAFTNNPVDLAIIGIEGRAKVLRETTKTLKLDGDDIVPPEWEMNAANGQLPGQMGQMMPQGPPAPGGPPSGPQGPPESEKPIGSMTPPEEQPIGGAPPAIPLERMADM